MNVSMKNLIIVGAGGFAKELIGYIKSDKDRGLLANVNIKGVLVDYLDDFQNLGEDYPYLGKIRDYDIQDNDEILVAIGENPGRNKIIEYFETKNTKFFSFIHSSCFVNPTASIGDGLIMTPFCMINANVILGNHALLNSYSAIGHDSRVGNKAILYPYAAINGGCKIGDNLTMGTKATIFPRIKIGNNCVITSHSYVKTNKDDDRFIHQKTKEIDLENRL